MVSVTNKSTEDFYITSSEINNCEYCMPYYVWMFTSIIEAHANAIDNFNNLLVQSHHTMYGVLK